MKKILLHYNFRDESLLVKEELEIKLETAGLVVVDKEPDLIIVIGGDGTMLSGIRLMRRMKVPFVGINTGTLGFLPSFSTTDIDKLITMIVEKNFVVQSYPLLKVITKTINGATIEKYAFNEVLIKHLEPRLMECILKLDSEKFNYFTGDGFIISTPIGSTGYAIWAGGVAMHSELPVYQLTPLNPNDNSVNRPLMSSMVLPIETVIDIDVISADTREVIVACDGLRVSNDFISEIHIRASHREIRILRDKKYSYYDLYKRKIIDKNVIRS